ncbi:hypothetical protein [Kitasatospora sp. NPDC059571]|uniref:hypothetical protein n=1 Tax=Kitasatospora sp. NPDC059571 TaxID=3346871 RepID=UPI00368A33BB
MHLLLSLPALLGIRWLFITATTAVAMGAYAAVLLTAAPMPPTQPPPPAVATGHH